MSDNIETDNAISSLIVGDVESTADFGTGTIEGTISNRHVEGTPYATVVLSDGTIAPDGTFVGTADGGFPTAYTSSGDFQGVLGVSFFDAGGAVGIFHADNFGTGINAEIGVFVAG